MVQPTKEHGAKGDTEDESFVENSTAEKSIEEEGRSSDTETQNKKYDELLDSLLNDKKNIAIKKHPELISAYIALEVYEHYFLAGGDWDEIGAIEFKKKMAKKIISDFVKKDELP